LIWIVFLSAVFCNDISSPEIDYSIADWIENPSSLVGREIIFVGQGMIGEVVEYGFENGKWLMQFKHTEEEECKKEMI